MTDFFQNPWTDRQPEKGFTLVELAIVLMIIGLLIGGILRGQEVYQNASIVATIKDVQALDTAVISFQNNYSALPGDILNPTSRIANCTGRCTMSGDGNNMIGPIATAAGFDYVGAVENNTFWLHLAKTKLITKVDPDSDWTSGATQQASYPLTPIGGSYWVAYYNHPAGALYPQAISGHWLVIVARRAGGASLQYIIPVNTLAKIDLKMDDGKPWMGTARLNGLGCNVALTATEYDMNNVTPCTFMFQTVY